MKFYKIKNFLAKKLLKLIVILRKMKLLNGKLTRNQCDWNVKKN
jgi:hypothetical protein